MNPSVPKCYPSGTERACGWPMRRVIAAGLVLWLVRPASEPMGAIRAVTARGSTSPIAAPRIFTALRAGSGVSP